MSKQIDYIIQLAKLDGYDMEKYSSYTLEQVIEIYRGLKEGVDVTIYNNIYYTADKMYNIRECLYLGFPKPERLKNYTSTQIKSILNKCKFSKLLVNTKEDYETLLECFLDNYTFEQIIIIAKALNDNLDITYLCNPKYTKKQMEQILLMLKEGINPKPVADENLDWYDMAIYRLKQ